MKLYFSLITAAALTSLVAFAGTANAENDFSYSCKKGFVTVKSKTPCYVSAYGISVPGNDADAKEGGQKDGGGGKKGGGFGGPKDLKDKPKGGGMNGPKDLKS